MASHRSARSRDGWEYCGHCGHYCDEDDGDDSETSDKGHWLESPEQILDYLGDMTNETEESLCEAYHTARRRCRALKGRTPWRARFLAVLLHHKAAVNPTVTAMRRKEGRATGDRMLQLRSGVVPAVCQIEPLLEKDHQVRAS